MKVLNGTKLILNESKLFPWSSRISLVPFRTFKGPLPVIGQELFLAVSVVKKLRLLLTNIFRILLEYSLQFFFSSCHSKFFVPKSKILIKIVLYFWSLKQIYYFCDAIDELFIYYKSPYWLIWITKSLRPRAKRVLASFLSLLNNGRFHLVNIYKGCYRAHDLL